MQGTHYRLVIGNKAWSSWSLRPWLVLTRYDIPFEEINIRLRQADTRQQILAHSPAGKVPALWADDLIVWDSLAIIDTIADRHPDRNIWPADRAARAIARSVSAEMHSGFQALREHCPMKLIERAPLASVPDAVEVNIRRIVAMWRECRSRFGGSGPFLFSEFSAADAMYAPVASRFQTYIPDLARFGDEDGTAQAYAEALLVIPQMAAWTDGARRELASWPS